MSKKKGGKRKRQITHFTSKKVVEFRGMGSPSTTHEAKARSFARHAVAAARGATHEVDAGNCRRAIRKLEDARQYEGISRGHYSATKEDRRGSGSDLQRDISVAQETVAEHSEFVRKHCVR